MARNGDSVACAHSSRPEVLLWMAPLFSFFVGDNPTGNRPREIKLKSGKEGLNRGLT